MLAVTSYKKDYVAACRAKVEAQLATFAALPKSAAKEEFAPQFFNHMILALDHYFLHRLRNAEGKDGNALNELRMLCNAIQDNGGVFAKDAQIKLDPAKSVTGIGFSEKIGLSDEIFARLASAVFDEIGKRYP